MKDVRSVAPRCCPPGQVFCSRGVAPPAQWLPDPARRHLAFPPHQLVWPL